MARHSASGVERLQNRTWGCQLLATAKSAAQKNEFLDGKPIKGSLRWLEHTLGVIDVPGGGVGEGMKLQSLEYVIREGGDPTKALRRIPKSELMKPERVTNPTHPKPDYQKRWPPEIRREGEVIVTFEIDFVARAESIFPGSAMWHRAPFWRLISAPLLPLEDIHFLVNVLLDDLTLIRPDRAARALYPHLFHEKRNRELTLAQRKERYAKSLSLW